MARFICLLLPSTISAMIASSGQIPYWAGGAHGLSFENSIFGTNQQLGGNMFPCASCLSLFGTNQQLGGIMSPCASCLRILQNLGSLQGFSGFQGFNAMQGYSPFNSMQGYSPFNSMQGYGPLPSTSGLQIMQLPFNSNTSPCTPCMICSPQNVQQNSQLYGQTNCIPGQKPGSMGLFNDQFCCCCTPTTGSGSGIGTFNGKK
ncbi:unnamed protein product [Cercopithifilaria johnstoni]|uniref:Uncharacterized protein n=1 Tax=Cercopithifilaria johnstoni TaxID=2874296 RepID=A0A8J2MKE3_9BILA|nr:unnamed protein product [Cercopithifilaria johnstoni]